MLKKIGILVVSGIMLAACSQNTTPPSTTTTDTTSTSELTYTTPTASPMPTISPMPSASPPLLMGKQVVVLDAQNNSGQTGTTTLEEVNGKVKVTIAIVGEPSEASEPAHIHAGSCPNPGAVLYPLTNVVNGKSETTLSVDMKTLQANGSLAVNLHKSAADLKTYMACGNIQ